MGKQAEVLVIGATGTVGREAARATLGAGGRVCALVRSERSASILQPGVEPVMGDLRNAESLVKALSGVRAAFYVSPHELDEEVLCDTVIRACEATGTRLVFVGVHADASTCTGRAVRRFLFGKMLPHYRPKLRLSERARNSKANTVVLMPTNFYQNDEIFLDELRAGRFLQDFERPINRVDVRDLGAAAARALLDPNLPRGAYPVVGPSSLDGSACAAIWSAELGRNVRCERDLATLDAAFTRAFEGKKRDDFVASYRTIRRFALPTEPTQLARTVELIGRAPTSYQQYVRGVVAAHQMRPRDSHAPLGA